MLVLYFKKFSDRNRSPYSNIMLMRFVTSNIFLVFILFIAASGKFGQDVSDETIKKAWEYAALTRAINLAFVEREALFLELNNADPVHPL